MNADLPDPLPEPLDRMQILVAIGVTAILLFTIAKIWQIFGQVTPLRIHWSWSDVGLGIVLGGGITLASGLLYLLWPQYRNSTQVYLDLIVQPLLWVDLIWLGVLPGLSEELLFRGMVLSAFGFGWLTLVVSNLCFGALHLSSWQQWPYGVWAMVVGLILALSVVWSGHLLVAVVAHICTNLFWGGLWKWRSSPPV
ncbi:MAG: CPBP family intramembrane glutamic endopeptidase [Prochlorothrix sp.]|nr:CPBP family intramembrane glutamic endopeptidase [Prochlorothrix sp.]